MIKTFLQKCKKLKDEEAKLRELLEIKIPETLESVGLKELKLTSGKKISIVDELAFNISEKNKPNCMKWLRDNDFDSIIKNVVSAQFAKGEDSKALQVYRELLAKGFNANDEQISESIFYLVDGPDGIVTEWTKWDLTSLGKVWRVEFNMAGTNDNGYGFSQPAYFAYDDVAVQFQGEKVFK